MPVSHSRYLLILSLVFAIWWIILAIEPQNRADWAMENVLVVAFAVYLVLSFCSFPRSRVSYRLILVFLLLHEIGAHIHMPRFLMTRGLKTSLAPV